MLNMQARRCLCNKWLRQSIMFVLITTGNLMIMSIFTTVMMMIISIDVTIVITVHAKCHFWNHVKVADTAQKPARKSSRKHRIVCRQHLAVTDTLHHAH